MPMFNFGGPQAQVPQQAQPQGGFLQQLLAPENAMPIAAALLGQNGNGQNFANAFSAYGQTAAQTAGKNRTLDFFRKNAPEYADMVQAGMPVNEAWQTYTQQRYAKQPKGQGFINAGGGNLFNSETGEWVSAPTDPNALPETGLQPQMMRDPVTGETIYVQATKDGRLIRSQAPEGFQPYDPYTKAYQTNLGKSQSENAATLPTDLKAADDTVKQIDQLIASPGVNAIVGPMDQYRPSWTMGGSGRDALARYNQLKGKAFLQAYGMLKGGGQITEVEGQKAQDAMARMDRAQDETTFIQALKDFRDAVTEGRQKLIEKAGLSPDQIQQAAPAPQGANRTQSGVSWTVEP